MSRRRDATSAAPREALREDPAVRERNNDQTMPQSRAPAPRIDAYTVLGVRHDASSADIRKAYKRLVLEAHPDKNPGRREWSERRVRELFAAFELIGEEDSRRRYDAETVTRARAGARAAHRPRRRREEDLFFFRKQDAECLALRVLYFLMHQRGQEAFDLVVDLEDRLGEDFLQNELDRSDFLDCYFLLGEFLLERKRYREALSRFLKVVRHQKKPRMRRPHYPLAVESLKALYVRHLPRVLSPRELIEVVREMPRELDWSRRDQSRVGVAVARAYLDLGELEQARLWLSRAREQDPGSSQVRRFQAEFTQSHGEQGIA